MIGGCYVYVHRQHSEAEGSRRRNNSSGSQRQEGDELAACKNVGSLVVTSGNAVVGLISEREIVHAIARYGETAISMPVSEVMRHGVITVSPTDTVSHVMSLMTRHRARHRAVLRDGNLVGIISIGDVVKNRLEDLELETNVLRDVYNAAR